MQMKDIAGFGMVFCLGFLSCLFVVGLCLNGVVELPLSLGMEQKSVNEANAPGDWVSEKDIHIFDDRIVIDIQGGSLSRYADTGSMKPVLDKGANGIRIKPASEKDVNVGDIISFEKNGKLVVHRVVEKGIDEEDVYFITKGDNNSLEDGKIRFKDIKYVTVILIW